MPGHEAYLNKTLTDSVDEARDNPEEYILKSKDFELRSMAVRNNQDIVALHFVNRIEKLLALVLPILRVTEYIIRYEVQHRGTIHAHILFSVEPDPCGHWQAPCHDDLERAYERVACTDEEKEDAKDILVKFSSELLGISAIHPSWDVSDWPGPLGGDPGSVSIVWTK